MKRILVLLLAFGASAASAQTSPLDGDWKGKSDGGSCNTPLEFALTIEAGIVDGTASDPAAHGPVPNLKKTAAPTPAPGLWQVYGTATANAFVLRALASVKGQERRETKFNGSIQGSAIMLKENGGCGRTVALARAK